MELLSSIPNFPFVITNDMIERRGEPTVVPEMVMFPFDEHWRIYCWKTADMKNWDVYIVEGSEWIVRFHAAGPGESFSWNIESTACPVARLNPYAFPEAYAWQTPRHPIREAYPKYEGRRATHHLFANASHYAKILTP